MSLLKYNLFLFFVLVSTSFVASARCHHIRNVDFKNRVYLLEDFDPPKSTRWLPVSNGTYAENHYLGGRIYFDIANVIFGDLTNDGKEEAAVVARYGAYGGNFNLTDTYVFSCVNKKVKLIGILRQEDIAKETERNPFFSIENPAKIKNNTLIVTYWDGQTHPTQRFTITFKYKIRNNRFVATSRPITRDVRRNLNYGF